MSVELLELTVRTLGELTDEVVFIGAATMPLMITATDVAPLRVTEDTDIVVAVSTKAGYDRFSSRLRKLKMHEDSSSRVIGRWRLDDSELVVDVLPVDTSILGYEGRWVGRVHDHPVPHLLADGTQIRFIRPELFLATKIEAFLSRGRGDYYTSKDFEDIVRLVEGRVELVTEVVGADEDLANYVAEWIDERVDTTSFLMGVAGALGFTKAAERAEQILIPRFRAMGSGAVESRG